MEIENLEEYNIQQYEAENEPPTNPDPKQNKNRMQIQSQTHKQDLVGPPIQPIQYSGGTGGDYSYNNSQMYPTNPQYNYNVPPSLPQQNFNQQPYNHNIPPPQQNFNQQPYNHHQHQQQQQQPLPHVGSQQQNGTKKDGENDMMIAVILLLVGIVLFPPALLGLCKYRKTDDKNIKIMYYVGMVFLVIYCVLFVLEVLVLLAFILFYVIVYIVIVQLFASSRSY